MEEKAFLKEFMHTLLVVVPDTSCLTFQMVVIDNTAATAVFCMTSNWHLKVVRICCWSNVLPAIKKDKNTSARVFSFLCMLKHLSLKVHPSSRTLLVLLSPLAKTVTNSSLFFSTTSSCIPVLCAQNSFVTGNTPYSSWLGLELRPVVLGSQRPDCLIHIKNMPPIVPSICHHILLCYLYCF